MGNNNARKHIISWTMGIGKEHILRGETTLTHKRLWYAQGTAVQKHYAPAEGPTICAWGVFIHENTYRTANACFQYGAILTLQQKQFAKSVICKNGWKINQREC